jgi:hypothetical protein
LAGAIQAQEVVTLVNTNALWKYFKGTNEASLPDTTAWRKGDFNETGWTAGPATFFYGESIPPGTDLTGMQNSYSTLFLRKKFLLTNLADIAELELNAVCDDGFMAWINGTLVARERWPAGEPLFNSLASTNAQEPVGFVGYPIANPENVLVSGLNVLAVQVFNVSLGSSDLVFDAELVATLKTATPPMVVKVAPTPGFLSNLTQITVTFSEAVQGVDAGDLRVNDIPATGLTGSGATYTFSFPQPSYGTVQIAWDMSCGITDLGQPPTAFNPTGPDAQWMYELVDPNRPVVAALNPPANQTVRQLSQIEVSFDKAVEGVDAADLLVNGQPATNVTGVAAGPYVFEFAAAPAGRVDVAWAAGHGIVDSSPDAHPFAGGSWQYTVNPQLVYGDVIINEFLAENGSGLKDEDGQEEDWIELYNRGSTAADLNGWSLTDDPREPGQWVFPAVTMPAKGYRVVFASGKDRKPTTPGGKLHTNFKLNIFGEYIGLYTPESPRQIVSEVAPQYPEQREDYSFGRDAYGNWRYFQTPTPGAANGASSSTNLVLPVHFSVKRGFFQRPFNLSLATETPDALIRYTVNGSTPGLTNGITYTNLIPITMTRIVRAAAFRTNFLPSRVVTHSYLMNLTAARRYLPAMSLVTASNNLFGKTGIMEINPRNTIYHGIAWERPVSVEYIRPDDNEGFQVDCGLRVHGGGYIRSLYNYKSGSVPENKYSFQLCFRTDYGPGRLEYPLFPDIPLQSFNSIVLRAGMNDPTNPFIRDEVARELAADVGQVAAHGTFVNLFLDGVYKGYYNPTEHINHDLLQDWHGGGDQWDVIAMGEVHDGDTIAWNALRTFANQNNLAVPTNYVQLERRLDTTNFVEYLIPLIYADTDDWPHNNWRAARERTPAGIYRMYVWDAEWSFGFNNGPNHNTIAGQLSSLNPPWGTTEIQQLFNRLKVTTEFKLLFADRVHKHFFNDGAMTDARIRARYEQIKGVVKTTISGFNDTIGTSWIPQRRKYLTNHFAQAGFLASSNAPVFNQFGGRAPRGFALTMTAGLGNVYYTTNGSDPRVRFTGAAAPDARLNDTNAPLLLDRSVVVRARTQWGTNWSAVTAAAFQVEEFGTPLRITEIMYNPPGGDAYEFIELQNISGLPLDLSGITLEGVEYRFVEGTWLAGGERLVLISDFNPALFAQRYPGVKVAGQFHGSLSNGGERLALIDRRGRTIVSVDYQDSDGWPTAADGHGYSLEIFNPNGDPDDPANWRASVQPGGSPGAPNPAVPLPALRLNEIMAAGAVENVVASAASGVPQAALTNDWIELHNAGTDPADLADWSLSNDGSPGLFVFPAGQSLAPGGYLVVWCDQQTNAPGLHASFRLNRHGETVYLFDPLGNRVDAVTLGLQIPNYSVGRTGPDAAAWQLTEPTAWGMNEIAQLASPTNVVINEFVANAAPDGDDWLELFNRDTNLPVALRGLFLGTSNALFQVTSLSFIAPGGFAVFHADENPGANHLDFKLPAARGAIALYDQNGVELSRITYANQAEGVSLGRLPDGSTNLTTFALSASPGTANYVAGWTGPMLNELMARNETAVTNSAGRVADWFELYNPNTNWFDLSGLSLSVNSTRPGQWVFPPGAVIQRQAHLVIWCDDSRPASTNLEANLNLGRPLPGEGGGVYMFNTGGQLVEWVEFGFQLRDQSIGRSGGNWALLSRPTPGASNAEPAPLGDPANLRLNEWMASSADGDWLEIYNLDALPVNLAGLTLTDDPSIAGQTNYVIGPLTFIGGRGWIKWKADGDVAKGRDHLGFRLDALGETIRLYSPSFNIIDTMDLPVQQPGVSQGRFPDGDTNLVSFPLTPSPGQANFLLLTNVFINEILTHTDPPLEDAIELFNPTKEAVPVGGWYLSDSRQNLTKFRIPDGTLLPAGGYLVFYEYQFNPHPGDPASFELDSAHGGEVSLSAADAADNLTGYRACAQFGAAENGVSFGRYQTSVGSDFVAMSRRTFGRDYPLTVAEFRTGAGLPNADPKLGPVVINEIMYHPITGIGTNAVENPDEEFVELHNLSAATVPLYDMLHPTNQWKLGGGIEFVFPPATSLSADGYLLVVGFDPATNAAALAQFQDKYRLAPGIRVFGPCQGRLANEGEALELQKPDPPQMPPRPDAGFVPYIVVERVVYGNCAPWPAAADGTGRSLQRKVAAAYGNDPANWKASWPTPGLDNSTIIFIDTDGDGLPDEWEQAYGLNPLVGTGADGADGDPDNDGLTNLQEYQAGTDPRALSVVIARTTLAAGGLHLAFNGVAGKSYAVHYRDSLREGSWLVWAAIMPPSTTREVELTIKLPTGVPARFFRIVMVGP